MNDTTLTEEAVYDAADIPNKSVPIEDILFVGFSLQKYQDLSIFNRMHNLRIVSFRLCGFTSVPDLIFSLSKLEKLDLSGNTIQNLPERRLFITLRHLKHVNLSDNNITDLVEVFKMSASPRIRQISLTGNICLSQHDSFNLIVKEFKCLKILNDMIITSQYRGFLDDVAAYDNNSTIPLAKIDDYIFLYVHYLHSPSNERYTRRFNSENFCLNHVIRHNSSAEKIQSIFRGYILRVKYKEIRCAAHFMKDFIKYWFWKRLRAANRIRGCFLHHLTRQKIKYIKSVKRVQSLWRRKMSRQSAMIEAFENKGEYCFLVTEKDIKIIIDDYISKYKLCKPKRIEATNYNVIRKRTPLEVQLPGSPIVYYSVDDSLIVRVGRKREIPHSMSIWCRHDHANTKIRKKVTRNGINWTKQCPFASIPLVTIGSPKRTIKFQKYEKLSRVVFTDYNDFTHFIVKLTSLFSPVTLIPERTLAMNASLIVIQSSMRMFIDRMHNFARLKTEAIEKRAIASIRYCIRTSEIQKAVSHIAFVHRYFRTLPHQNSFYIPFVTMKALIDMRPVHQLQFGYTADKSVIISTSEVGEYITEIIPAGKIMFALNDLSSLVNIGCIVTKAQSSLFSNHMSNKYLKRYNILRVTFANPEEARRRLALIAWLTERKDIIMPEKEICEYCYANVIHSSWRGFSSRRNMQHFLAQIGRSLKIVNIAKQQLAKAKNGPNNRNKYPRTNNNNNNKNEGVLGKINKDAEESIKDLRNDYRPWQNMFEQFKADQESKIKPKKTQKVKIEEDPLFPSSTKCMGNTTSELKETAELTSCLVTAPQTKISLNQSLKSKDVAKTQQLKSKIGPNFLISNDPNIVGNKSGSNSNLENFALGNSFAANRKSSAERDLKNLSVRNNNNTNENKVNIDVKSANKTVHDQKIAKNNSFNAKSQNNNSITPKNISQENQNILNNIDNINNLNNLNNLYKLNNLNTISKLNNDESTNNNDHTRNNSLKRINHLSNDFNQSDSNNINHLNNVNNNNNNNVSGKPPVPPPISGASTNNKELSFFPVVAKRPVIPTSYSSFTLNPIQFGKETNIITFGKKRIFEELKEEEEKKLEEKNKKEEVEEELVNFEENPRVMEPFLTSSPKQKTRKKVIPPVDSMKLIQKRAIHLSMSTSQITTLNYLSTNFDFLKPLIEKVEETHMDEMYSINNFKNYNKINKNLTQSAQHNSNAMKELVLSAFSKLVRLHHIGTIITSCAVVDNTIEKNRFVSKVARDDLEKARQTFSLQKTSFASEAQERASIEKQELLETIQEKREEANAKKIERVRKIKNDQITKREKFNRDKMFGQNFLSVTRKNKAWKGCSGIDDQKKDLFDITQQRHSSFDFKKSKEIVNEAKREIELQNKRMAQLDKIALSRKLKRRDDDKLRRFERIYEEKRKMKERKRLAPKVQLYIPPTITVAVLEDETASAVKSIGEHMGENVGEVESVLLIDILKSILDC